MRPMLLLCKLSAMLQAGNPRGAGRGLSLAHTPGLACTSAQLAPHLVLKVGVGHGLASHGQADPQGVRAVLVHRAPHGLEVACGMPH